LELHSPAEIADSLGLAMLVVLESLTSPERLGAVAAFT
jgi:hypothetical protein